LEEAYSSKRIILVQNVYTGFAKMTEMRFSAGGHYSWSINYTLEAIKGSLKVSGVFPLTHVLAVWKAPGAYTVTCNLSVITIH
jgi:hypothetical protein